MLRLIFSYTQFWCHFGVISRFKMLSGALKVTKEETRGSATIDELTEFRNSVKKVEYRNYFDIQHNI
jgi:hypothetical protein